MGRDIQAYVENTASGRSMVAKYVKIHHIVGQGNFVVAYSQVQIASDDYAFFDLFRVKEGKIVEHWDVQEKILSEDQWGNSGKF